MKNEEKSALINDSDDGEISTVSANLVCSEV